MQKTVDLIRLAKLLIANRKLILACTAGAIVVSSVISLVLPQWFRARASVLPPESGVGQQDVISIMRFAGYRPAAIPALTSASEIYSAVLRSNRVTDAVIDSLDLTKAFGDKSRGAVREIIWSGARVSVTSAGLVLVDYEDKDPSRAAAVANAFVAELDRFYTQTRVTTARKVRELIETQMRRTGQELEAAQAALKTFKQRTGAIMIPEQTHASIQTAAGLYGRIAELEVSLERISQFATDKSPEVVDTKAQIRALERKLGEMGYTDAGDDSSPGAGVKLFPKFSASPTLEEQMTDLVMAVEIKTSVYKVLSEQYEEARIQEVKDTPAIQVLDWAERPHVRSRPKRKLIVAISTVAALFLSSLWVIYRTRTDRLATEEESLA